MLAVNLHEVRSKVMNHGAESKPVSPGGGHVLHVYTRITVSYPAAPELQRLRTASLAHFARSQLPFSPFFFHALRDFLLQLSQTRSFPVYCQRSSLTPNCFLKKEKEISVSNFTATVQHCSFTNQQRYIDTFRYLEIDL